jgi:hypothetical protein
MSTPSRFARIAVLLAIPALFVAADLQIPVADPDDIVIDVYSDTQCPIQCWVVTPWDSIPRCPTPPCDSIPCCDTFQAIVTNQSARQPQPDFTYLNGDAGIDSHSWLDPDVRDRFFSIWNQLPGPKVYGMGNHEADVGTDSSLVVFIWADSTNHYAPANWWEPAFGCDSTTAIPDCRRWFSTHFGSPPRAALLVLNNNSDTNWDDTFYPYCLTPFDSLNTAGSAQRTWFNAEIDSLPASVEVVFVACHRTYYGVENLYNRPNILYSHAEFPDAPAETLRTGSVSFLRDVESIYDRKPNVKWVFMINGDQHCFAETVPIKKDKRNDKKGVVYLTVGISGARINRASPYPALSKIPPGALVFAFDDRWGSTRFDVLTDRVTMKVHEAYTDSLLYSTFWPFDKDAIDAPLAGPSVGPVSIRAWPNPADSHVQVAVRVPEAMQDEEITEIAVYDVAGRKVRALNSGRYVAGEILRTWDLTNETRGAVASGVYFVRAQIGVESWGAKVEVRR